MPPLPLGSTPLKFCDRRLTRSLAPGANVITRPGLPGLALSLFPSSIPAKASSLRSYLSDGECQALLERVCDEAAWR